MVILRDDFSDNSTGTAWTKGALTATQDLGVTCSETNQRVEITPKSSTAGEHYNGYLTAAVSLAGGGVTVEVVGLASGGTADTQLSVVVDGSNYYAIIVESGTIYFQKRVAGTRSNVSATYNSSTHRFWRIRHATNGDTVYWDTSTDGVTWTNRRSAARELALTAVRLELIAGTYESVATPGTALFDNVTLENSRRRSPGTVFC